ncbi:MAG: DUF1573 domain-containing protein [Planctomycetes bacterium]|nr:DUF1573 domain-containing protein [Planctomycetota bacterium]
MKTWLIVIVSALIGVGAGIAAGVIEVRISTGTETIPVDEILKSASKPATEKLDGPPQPKVAIDKDVYDFGTMDAKSLGKHKFVVRNVGNAPLNLTKGSTTCKCAMSALEKQKVLPGESTTVSIEWTPKGYLGDFEQTAKVETNDPLRPELTLKVKGRITTVLHASPSELVFTRISAGHTTQGEVRLYAFASDSMQVTGHEMKDPSTAEFFDVVFEPMSAAQVSGEAEAKSGYLMEVHVKSGLPQGPFQQTILVRTNLASAPVIEVPVTGKVGSDISVFGRGWNEETGALKLGLLDPRKGADASLTLVVRGRHRDTTDFHVAEVFPPDILQVELGEKTQINQGVATQTPLKIHITKGTGPANHLGSKQGKIGRIVLDTNDPQMPKLTIRVSFAIEGE